MSCEKKSQLTKFNRISECLEDRIYNLYQNKRKNNNIPKKHSQDNQKFKSLPNKSTKIQSKPNNDVKRRQKKLWQIFQTKLFKR